MKDQNSLEDNESKQDKWNRGLDIFIESVHKPDPSLRECARNQNVITNLWMFVMKFSNTSKLYDGIN